jgi:hypothetical protein
VQANAKKAWENVSFDNTGKLCCKLFVNRTLKISCESMKEVKKNSGIKDFKTRESIRLKS